MRTLRFEVMGFSRTIYDFYLGLGMLVTLYLAYSAVLAWQLARFAQSSRPAARVLAWPFAVGQVGLVVFNVAVLIHRAALRLNPDCPVRRASSPAVRTTRE